jgi:5'(3')-deoxyribonucleotidase
MKIAIDVDGVLAEQVPHALARLEGSGNGVSKTKEDIRQWDEPLPEADTDIEKVIVESLNDPEFVLGMEPVEGSISAVRDLSQAGHELFIITHRPRSTLDSTCEWLKEHGIYQYVDNILRVTGPKVEGSADVLIDDNATNIFDFVHYGGHGILFSQPWNQSAVDQIVEDEQMSVAEDWTAVVEIIRKLSTERKVFE